MSIEAGSGGAVTAGLLVDRRLVPDGTADTLRVALGHSSGAAEVVVGDLDAPGGRGRAMTSVMARASGSVIVFVDAAWGEAAASVVDRLAGVVAPSASPGDGEPRVAVGQPAPGAAAPDRGLPGGTVDVLLRPVAELLLPGLGWLRRPLDAPLAVGRPVLAALAPLDGPAAGLDLIVAAHARYGEGAVVPVVLDDPWPAPPPVDDPAALATAVLGVVLPRVTGPATGPVTETGSGRGPEPGPAPEEVS